MAQPTPYSLSYDFTAFQVSNPTTPLPADKHEVEYNNIALSIGEIIDNLALIQRDDGGLANESVGTDQLAPGILAILGAGSGDIAAVAAIDTEITILAGLDTEITALAGLDTEIAALGAITTELAGLHADLANVDLVAGDIANVNTVAGIMPDVIRVGDISANVTTVAGVATEIVTLSGLVVEITRLGLITGAISGVYANETNINTVATNIAGVNTVAGIAAAVSAVAAIDTAVSTVAANDANISTVATDIANVNTVAANMATITDAANNIPKANRTATTNPGVGDDTADGYSEASVWVNTTSDEVFFCADPALGAALWVSVSAAGTLSTLADVTFTGLAAEDFIKYNGSVWINRTPSDVRTDLGLVIGTNVQAYDADLAAIAGLTSAANKGIYFTGAATAATYDLSASGRAMANITGGANKLPYFSTDSTTVTTTDLTSFGRQLIDDSSSTVARQTLGVIIGTDVQAYNANLTTYAGIAPSANVQTFLGAADYSAMRTQLGLVIGIDVQAQDAELAAIAGLTSAADRLPYFTGSGTAALATFTAAGRAILDDATADAQLTTLGAVKGGSFTQLYGTQSATIASGVITITSTAFEVLVIVDTEASAATDDITSITGGIPGQRVIFRSANSGRDPTFVHGSAIILNGSANFVLASTGERLELLCNSSGVWIAPTRKT